MEVCPIKFETKSLVTYQGNAQSYLWRFRGVVEQGTDKTQGVLKVGSFYCGIEAACICRPVSVTSKRVISERGHDYFYGSLAQLMMNLDGADNFEIKALKPFIDRPIHFKTNMHASLLKSLEMSDEHLKVLQEYPEYLNVNFRIPINMDIFTEEQEARFMSAVEKVANYAELNKHLAMKKLDAEYQSDLIRRAFEGFPNQTMWDSVEKGSVMFSEGRYDVFVGASFSARDKSFIDDAKMRLYDSTDPKLLSKDGETWSYVDCLDPAIQSHIVV
jgi:hypothetical protein